MDVRFIYDFIFGYQSTTIFSIPFSSYVEKNIDQSITNYGLCNIHDVVMISN